MSEPCKLLQCPPVGEMNHGIGLCYCQMCTCGEHKCPGDYLKNQKYLHSALTSIYKKDYTKKPGVNTE